MRIFPHNSYNLYFFFVIGRSGLNGPQGIRGRTGMRGLKGAQGRPGLQGRVGFQGITNAHSTPSIDCICKICLLNYLIHLFTGSAGIDGEAGRDGPKGKRGMIETISIVKTFTKFDLFHWICS